MLCTTLGRYDLIALVRVGALVVLRDGRLAAVEAFDIRQTDCGPITFGPPPPGEFGRRFVGTLGDIAQVMVPVDHALPAANIRSG